MAVRAFLLHLSMPGYVERWPCGRIAMYTRELRFRIRGEYLITLKLAEVLFSVCHRHLRLF